MEFFFASRRRHTRYWRDWSSDVCSSDLAKLAMWKLIESKPRDDNDTTRRTSGRWRPTREGFAFVYGRIRISRYALVYNAKLLGYDGHEVSIKDALGDRFNYTELMQR